MYISPEYEKELKERYIKFKKNINENTFESCFIINTILTKNWSELVNSYIQSRNKSYKPYKPEKLQKTKDHIKCHNTNFDIVLEGYKCNITKDNNLYNVINEKYLSYDNIKSLYYFHI